MELPYDPQVHSWVYIQKRQKLFQKNAFIPMFIIALFTIAKTWKQPKCSQVEQYIKRMYICICVYMCVCTYIYTYIYTHTYIYGILHSHKKNEIIPFAAPWMDLEIINLCEVSETEKDKYHMISLLCGM